METSSAPLTERRYLLPFILVTSLFFLWALGVNLNDILIPHLKKAFSLTDFQSSLIQSAFFGGYFIAALPAGWVMERVGYKKGILIGLLVCATGAFLFIPASYIRIYGFFLFALFIMACGQSFLEVAANPYVTILGPPESSERRLNFAQSFNAVGAVVTPFIGAAFILSGIEHTPAQLAAMPPGQEQAYRALEASRRRTDRAERNRRRCGHVKGSGCGCGNLPQRDSCGPVIAERADGIGGDRSKCRRGGSGQSRLS